MLKPQFENIDLQASERGYRVNLNQHTTQQAIVALLEWLPFGYEFAFYDQYYPSVSDPGAYISIQRKQNSFVYYMGNHGWSQGWQIQSKQMLAALIHINNGTNAPFQDKIFQMEIRKARTSPKW